MSMFVRNESFNQFIRLYPVVTTLIAINTFFIILQLLLPSLYQQYIYINGVGVNYLVMTGEYWRLVTPIFLHGGLGHFIFNNFALLLFGPALEVMFGRWKFLTLYLAAGIIGNIGSLFFMEGGLYSLQAHLGASGAIYGLLGVYLYFVLMRKDLIDHQSGQIIIVMLIIGTIYSLVMPRINISAHLFGFVGGALLAPILTAGKIKPYSPYFYFHSPQAAEETDSEVRFDPNRWQKRRFWNKHKKKIIWGIFILFIVIGMLNNCSY